MEVNSQELPKNNLYRDNDGILLGGIWNPLDSVGLYVPGGNGDSNPRPLGSKFDTLSTTLQ